MTIGPTEINPKQPPQNFYCCLPRSCHLASMSLSRMHVAMTAMLQSRSSEQRSGRCCAKIWLQLQRFQRQWNVGGVTFLRDAWAVPGSCMTTAMLQLKLQKKTKVYMCNSMLCVELFFLDYVKSPTRNSDVFSHWQRNIYSLLERCALT